MLGRKLPKNRRFNIEFQYYDPAKDEREGRRIHFERGRYTRKAAKAHNMFWLILLVVMTYFIIRYLVGISAQGG